MINDIAAHKDELQKLLEDLASDRLVSRRTFAALVNAYIARLDADSLDIVARVSIRRQRKQMENKHLQPASTQSRMRYYEQHTTSGQPIALFHRFRAAARKQAPGLRRRSPREERFRRLPLFRDNGR
jgi:hypothetical protein